jgi:HlyD family secretion protein
VKRASIIFGWKGALAGAVLLLSGCDKGSSEALVLLGTLERDTLYLTAPVQEQVVERPVREGQRVEAGALVARLDDTRLRAELSIHLAALERARAQLAELEAGTTRERIAQAQADHAGALAAAENATSDLRRLRKLHSDRLIAESELDRARAAAKEADARKARTAQVLAELQRGPRAEAIDAARAALAEAEARVREAQVRLGQLELRAPAAGVIEELPYEIGERPVPGAIVAILVAEATPYVRVFVPERAVGLIEPGHPSRIVVDGVPATLGARFGYIAQDAMFTPYYALTDAERDRLAFQAKVEVTDPRARALRSGVPVRVLVSLAEVRTAEPPVQPEAPAAELAVLQPAAAAPGL